MISIQAIFGISRGHGHMLQCLGAQPCHFILIFDNGYFSEFGTFSITDWIGHAPKPLLAKNLGLPEATFRNISQARDLLCPRRHSSRTAGRASARLEVAGVDAQVSSSLPGTPRGLSGRSRVAG